MLEGGGKQIGDNGILVFTFGAPCVYYEWEHDQLEIGICRGHVCTCITAGSHSSLVM